MSSSSIDPTPDAIVTAADAPDPRRWLALGVIAIAQLMIILDASIVNIALPSAQADLGISDASRQWVITAYTIAFGGLLLLGGRIADFSGRKKIFIIGLLGFAGASALGGIATSQAMLFGARALQGAFAALLAPAALSLITVTFTESRERARAFGVYGAISGGGAAIGLIVGGVLTEYFSWRWCLLVNVPIALVAAGLAVPYVRESKAQGDTRYDIPGAITATTGLVALVFALTKAGTPGDGWSAPITVASFVAAAVLLVSFVLIERTASHPLLPLRVVTDRNRGGSYGAMFMTSAGLFGMFLFLTYYFQATLGYSALKSGFAFLPFSLGIIVSAGIASQMLPKSGPRWLATGGLVSAAVGMAWLTQITPDTAYVTHVLPAMLLISLGMGFVFVPLSATALFGVQSHDAGVASAVLNSAQQIGGSLGTALLNTIAATATASFLIANPGLDSIQDGLVTGYTTAFWVGAALLAAAAVVVAVTITADKHSLAQHDVAVPAG
ncbi:MAG TPA: MFS transporter [Candidatus Limnocylindria bacterium]|nr:MFS transporter [Candidatus Limnocylindria bacterium]